MENSAVDGVMKSKDVMPQFRRDTSVDKPDEKDVAVDRRESRGDVAEEHESLACWLWYRELINSVRTYGPITAPSFRRGSRRRRFRRRFR